MPFFEMLILHEQARACTDSVKGIETFDPIKEAKKKKEAHIVSQQPPATFSPSPGQLLALHLPPHPSPCEPCVCLSVQPARIAFLLLFSVPKTINANGEMKLGLEEASEGLAWH